MTSPQIPAAGARPHTAPAAGTTTLEPTMTDSATRRSRRSARDAGTRAETAVARYLRDHGFAHAERRARRGRLDEGDIAGIPGVVIEVKDCRQLTLSAWLREADVERDHAGAWLGAVWHKRSGRADPGEWYVTMTGAAFAALLHDADAS